MFTHDTLVDAWLVGVLLLSVPVSVVPIWDRSRRKIPVRLALTAAAVWFFGGWAVLYLLRDTLP